MARATASEVLGASASTSKSSIPAANTMRSAHRRALHLAEVLEQAHRSGAKGGVT